MGCLWGSLLRKWTCHFCLYIYFRHQTISCSNCHYINPLNCSIHSLVKCYSNGNLKNNLDNCNLRYLHSYWIIICCSDFDSNLSNYYFDNLPKRLLDFTLRNQDHFLTNYSVDVALINPKHETCVTDLFIQILDTSSLQFNSYKGQNSFLATCQRLQNNYRFCFKSSYKCI